MNQIGVGVLGPVFRTCHSEDDRLVALKAFYLDLTPEQATTLADALRGIVQAGVVHPCLVTPVGAGLSDNVAYLALEYVAADSLDVAIRQYAPGSVGTTLPFVVQLAEALDAAHAGGLSHGALHLRDVFVTPELARVTGFGVVPALDRVKVRGPLRRPYTAPEQMAGAEWGGAADRFALAAIAYELLTGKRLAGTGEQVTDRLADMAGVRDVTRLRRLFAGALADTPERRPASARLFADELADAVGWTGVDVVRQALVTMGSEAGDPEHQEDVPVIAVSGILARPSVGGETTGTEGAALDMEKNRRERTSEPLLDWTERKLDRGESDELRAPEAYSSPRPPGAPPDRPRRGPAPRGTVPDFDRIDAALEGTRESTLDDAFAAEVVEADVADQESAAEGRTPAEPASAGNDDDGEDDAGRARAGGQGPSGDGTAPVARDADADLSVVQARYRQLDVSAESPGDIQDSQAAGVYETITVSDLQERLDATAGAPEDDAGGDADPGKDLPAGLESGDEDVDGRADPMLRFESDAEEEEDDDRNEHERFQAGLVASGWADRVRELPLVPVALVGVVLMVAAFAVGFRLVAGGNVVATDTPSVAPAVLAGDVADPFDATAPAEPAPQVSREFSEASVARSPVVEAPVLASVETPPASPGLPASESAPEEPEVPAAAEPRARGAARGAPVALKAPEPVSPTANGRLLMRSTPPGVRVVVNGEARGTTPLALGDLSYGAYDILFSLEGHESQDRRLALSQDDPIATINADLARVADTRTASLGVGSIFVDTRPRGVEVWLDQQLIGESPMLIPNVSTGAHQVEFRHAGYRNWTTTVQVDVSGQARVTASLDHVSR
jgi:hypothetical protein